MEHWAPKKHNQSGGIDVTLMDVSDLIVLVLFSAVPCLLRGTLM